MPADTTECDGREPWLRYRGTGLCVVPSVHYRLVFAQAVYEACSRRRFDTIAVELPSSYQGTALVEAIASMPPHPGVVLLPRPEVEVMPVPLNGDPECRETELRPVSRAVCLPISPCDSIVMALRCPALLAEHWPGWRPDVLLLDRDHTPGDPGEGRGVEADDYEVRVRGLATFCARFEEPGFVHRDAAVDALREQTMATRLRRLLDEGREILFVCGAGHWARIRRLLDQGGIEEAAREDPEPRKAIVAALDPPAAWFLGWLDDIPRVVWDFEASLLTYASGGFDKRAAVRTVLRESLEESRDDGRARSVRRHLLMSRFGERLLAAAGRWTPTLDDDLLPAARVCVEEGFADTVKEVGLRYPAPAPEGVPRAELLFGEGGERMLRVGSDVFVLPTPPPRPGGRLRRLRVAKSEALTPAEREELRTCGAYLRDWPDEVSLRWTMDARARELARRRDRAHRARPFRGNMAQGPDWRATIRSLARGRDELYVREADARRRVGPARSVVAPVVWIFDDQCPLAGFNSTEQPLTEDDWYHSSFLYLAGERRLADRRIRSFDLAAFVDLFLSRSYAGPRFPTWPPDRQMATDMGYLHRVPPEKRCTCPPWRDPELERFHGVDQAIAAAVKYAIDQVILVSRSSRPVAAEVTRYASDRGVSICRVSIDDFAPARLDRFRLVHFVPCPGDPFQPPYDWCSRFVPPT